MCRISTDESPLQREIGCKDRMCTLCTLQHYGFDRGDIGRLFIAGFGSSAVFGTIVGSLADKT